jgi:heat shock protein HslJ
VLPRLARVLIAGTTILAVSGCHWNDDVDSKVATYGLPVLRQDLEANEWLLDRADSSLAIADSSPITLAIEGDTVSGSGPCNRYHGPFHLDGHSVEIGPLARTNLACAGATMRAEDELFRALARSTTVHVTDHHLVLTGDGSRLSFASSTPTSTAERGRRAQPTAWRRGGGASGAPMPSDWTSSVWVGSSADCLPDSRTHSRCASAPASTATAPTRVRAGLRPSAISAAPPTDSTSEARR